uniref:Phosphatidylinositol-specific phospholipase C X domain-containing protein n=1 Tax=Setaria italica TaxID=4555 RepID=K3ZL77_SETIT
MGSVISFLDVPRRLREAAAQEQALAVLLSSSADSFPGSGYRPGNHKKWMEGLGASNVRVNQVVWPGTHDSATNGISAAPLAQCQTLSVVYEQLAMGCRVLDKDRRVCHGILLSYPVDVVLDDVKRFLEETTSEFVILEIRTEYDQQDPPEFARYLVDRLGDHLIRQDDRVFNKTTAKLLPKRVICVWKPRQSPAPKPGEPLWRLDQHGHAQDKYKLSRNPPVTQSLASLAVEPVTRWIRRFARLFISRVFVEGHGNKLQVFSTDFIDENFVNACIGFTKARIDGARA